MATQVGLAGGVKVGNKVISLGRWGLVIKPRLGMVRSFAKAGIDVEPGVLSPVTQVFPQAVFKGICDLQTFTGNV